MPYVRISLIKGKSPEYIKKLSDGIHQSLVEFFEVPLDDRFQVVHQHEPYELIYDKHYMGGPRSENYVLICVTAGRVRSTKVKQEFYQNLVECLNKLIAIRPEDIMVVINTTQADEWSFSNGNSIVPPAK
ncbi:tautomerase family protein [Cellvibrio sp. NN19]|uniref:tautomerase family protein n=1 Tax=Cellvibrio chitinivorans TaxID=3102792 RepID=UPI002B407D82|nr:tautomerase family protein [Cellvibrio sp. NN19]